MKGDFCLSTMQFHLRAMLVQFAISKIVKSPFKNVKYIADALQYF
jgi:hypothetical protein